MSHAELTETNRKNIQAVIEGITSGKLLEGFETYYAEDVVMTENGDPEQTRTGKPVCRDYEKAFVANAEFHDVRVGDIVADGDRTGYEMYMDATVFGTRIQRTQWAHQVWKDGQIVKEIFYYA